MLPGESAVVLTAGTTTDPDSGETLKNWATATSTIVGDVLVGWLPAQPLLTVTGVVTTRVTLYFQTIPTVPLFGTRVRVRGVTYEVLGEPLDWRLGEFRGLEVPVIDLLTTNRSAAEDVMVDTCRIEQPSGSTTSDAGVVSSTYTTLYTGKCRVQLHGTTSGASTREVGDQQVAVLTVEVQVPVAGTEGIHVRDRITILRATHDTDLVGRVFRVLQPAPSSDAPARLLQCLEVTA